MRPRALDAHGVGTHVYRQRTWPPPQQGYNHFLTKFLDQNSAFPEPQFLVQRGEEAAG